MTNIQIENAIYGWLNGLLNLTTIFAYPNAPRPTSSYVLINFLTDIQNGTKETEGVLKIDESTDNTYSTFNTVTLSINTYYDGAFQNATNIKNSLMKLAVEEYLYGAGLGYIEATQIQKIPEQIDKKWEERAQFDISFSVRREITENIETIKKVEVNNTIIGE